MKFSDIDFSAISRIMDSMSDEEKDKLNDMAQNMMSDIQKPQESEEEEEIDDFYAFLGIKAKIPKPILVLPSYFTVRLCCRCCATTTIPFIKTS